MRAAFLREGLRGVYALFRGPAGHRSPVQGGRVTGWVGSLDLATEAGIDLTGGIGRGTGLRMRAVGNEPAARLAETVHRLDLD